LTLRALARKIGGRFGITCDTFPADKPDPTGNVSSFRLENESPWTKLIGEADNQGYIFTSNEAGGLYLWEAASGLRGEGFHLTEGRNIKNIQWTENGAEQFHKYIITGGGHPPVEVIDSTCRGGRILTVDLTDPDIVVTKLQRRAETEMRRRRENKTTVSVSGWGLSDEQIRALGAVTKGKEIFWNPNFLIPVKIPKLGLDDKLLISEAVYHADPESAGCDLTLVRRDAYL
jgi:prophage tail gpP-like protein